MIKINLVSAGPEAAATKKAAPEISLGSRQGDIILLVLLAIGLAVTGGQWYRLHKKYTDLKTLEAQRTQERNELQKYIDKVNELESKRAQLKAKVDTIRQLKENQRGPVRILDEVSRALPELVWLTDLTLNGNHLKLTGMALDENAFANYVDHIDASPFFGEPTVGILKRGKGSEFSWQLECNFTYTPSEITSAGAEG